MQFCGVATSKVHWMSSGKIFFCTLFRATGIILTILPLHKAISTSLVYAKEKYVLFLNYKAVNILREQSDLRFTCI